MVNQLLQDRLLQLSSLFSVVMCSRLQPGVGLNMLPEFIGVHDRDVLIILQPHCFISVKLSGLVMHCWTVNSVHIVCKV